MAENGSRDGEWVTVPKESGDTAKFRASSVYSVHEHTRDDGIKICVIKLDDKMTGYFTLLTMDRVDELIFGAPDA